MSDRKNERPIKVTGLMLGKTGEVPREKYFLKHKFEWMGDVVQIGDWTYGDLNIVMGDEGKKLKIGKYCSLAAGCKIFLGQYHRADWITTYPFTVLPEEFPEVAHIKGHPYSPGDVTIGNDVWIGTDVTIMAGVTIGDGAIIGAKALVTKNVAPYTIAGGNPAKEIRKRFDEETIARLLEIKWWDWPEEKLRKNLPLLVSGDTQKLFDVLSKQ